jgi:mannose-6-phosphate isomerase-like protein (cupin superfamily)
MHESKGTDMANELKVQKLADLPRERRLHEGRMERWSVRTEGAQIVFGDITPQPLGSQGNHREPHDHPFDMLLVVVKGTMMQEVEGVDYKVEAGTAMLVPSYFMHRGYAYGPETASLFEVFAPARRDYIDLVEYQREYQDSGKDWVKEGTFTTTPFTKNDPSKGLLPIYRLADMPSELVSGNVKARRRSLRTEYSQIVWTDVDGAAGSQSEANAKLEAFRFDKLLIVNNGAATVRTADGAYEVANEACVVIPARLPHKIELHAGRPASLIEVYSPARRDLNHLVSHQTDQFRDQGQDWALNG